MFYKSGNKNKITNGSACGQVSRCPADWGGDTCVCGHVCTLLVHELGPEWHDKKNEENKGNGHKGQGRFLFTFFLPARNLCFSMWLRQKNRFSLVFYFSQLNWIIKWTNDTKNIRDQNGLSVPLSTEGTKNGKLGNRIVLSATIVSFAGAIKSQFTFWKSFFSCFPRCLMKWIIVLYKHFPTIPLSTKKSRRNNPRKCQLWLYLSGKKHNFTKLN